MKRSKLFDNEGQEDPKAYDKPDYTCAANGCPLRATVTDATSGPFRHGRCRYHDQVRPEAWPAVTQVFRNNPFRRSVLEPQLNVLGINWREDQPIPHAAVKPPGMSSREWADHHLSLIEIAKRAPAADPKDWARTLKAREEAGETLHPIQAKAWREALGETMTEAQREALDERMGMQQYG